MSGEQTANGPRQVELATPARWVEEHADQLFRYGIARLRQPEVVEDLVQDTFLAAFRAKGQFAGRSTERTWLIGILKRKIVDHLRRRSREQPATDLVDCGQSAESLFDQQGNWNRPPGPWPDPAVALESQEFRTVFAGCLGKLPERLADAFVLREVERLDSAEVCKVLNVSANNLWVMLHRARLSLCRCLEVRWFSDKG